ncbi:hypothetical protein DFP72DRAFT_22189 [Ephemerocybe angulata]|uniref:Uncharacterized protein n=1 Tax=Ephemerocybe angulata TaxID=980116 RepID=A0A8H6IJC3_9AGAR|nr:hypothetical protein DFP72DRAFT_22189 [Tulosesus angulatus]
MSAAASIHELEETTTLKPETVEDESGTVSEREALDKLTTLSPAATSGPLIAIDLDDVLCQTNVAVAQWHNDTYGTEMKLSDFLYYYYWKNPYWGTPQETGAKVRDFYGTDRLYTTKPVPGAREGIQALKQLGFRLIIVTARYEDTADQSWKWVDHHFPGCFSSIICTGQFTDAHKTGHEVVTKLTKAQVCDDLKAVLLIDDSAENAYSCVTAKKPIATLLFGDYEWNKRMCTHADAKHDMSFEARSKLEGGREYWKDETVPVPEGAPLWRVRDWSETVRWIKARKEEGRFD